MYGKLQVFLSIVRRLEIGPEMHLALYLINLLFTILLKEGEQG